MKVAPWPCAQHHKGQVHHPSMLNGIGVSQVNLHREAGSRFRMIVDVTLTLDDRRPESRIVIALLSAHMGSDKGFDAGAGSFAEKLRKLADDCDAEVAREQLQQNERQPRQRLLSVLTGSELDELAGGYGCTRGNGEDDATLRARIAKVATGMPITKAELVKVAAGMWNTGPAVK